MRVPAVWVFLFAVALRLPFAFMAPAGSYRTPFTSDFVEDVVAYVDLGHSLADHGVFGFGGRASAFRPPLYPWMVGAVFATFGEDYRVIRLLQALLGGLAAAALYALGRRLFDERVGLLAGVGLAAYPMLLYFTGEIMTETLYVAVSIGAVALTVRCWQVRTVRSAVLAGSIWGLAVLCRPTAVYCVIGLVVLAAVRFWRKDRTGAGLLVVVALVAAVVTIPWVVRNSLAFGRFVPVTTYTGINLYKGLPDKDNRTALEDLGYNHHQIEDPKLQTLPADEVALDARARAYWRAFVSQHPGAYAAEKLRDLRRFWFDFNLAGRLTGARPVLVLATFAPYLVVLVLAIFGLARALKEGRSDALVVTLGMVGITLLAYVPFYAGKRYRMPTVDPYLILMSAYWLSGQLLRLRGRRERRAEATPATAPGRAKSGMEFRYCNREAPAEELKSPVLRRLFRGRSRPVHGTMLASHLASHGRPPLPASGRGAPGRDRATVRTCRTKDQERTSPTCASCA